ncbi:MAG TPA: hypothetical protein VIA62_19585 [Thermoanaerobaculia bacterium]|jgi:hypothetical protein|nr:hypothetical protein [Thermoanaerobaculia bacterium]
MPGTAALGIAEGPNEATGYAFNSTDLDRAFSNAIDNLRAKFPGNINAVVKTIGFNAVGTPIGIAATYVTVQKI